MFCHLNEKPFTLGKVCLHGPPFNFQAYIPVGYCPQGYRPQIRRAIGSMHFLICKTHPSCFLFSAGGKNLTSMNNALMPWGTVVTSWCSHHHLLIEDLPHLPKFMLGYIECQRSSDHSVISSSWNFFFIIDFGSNCTIGCISLGFRA
jgi:hypothetical protein